MSNLVNSTGHGSKYPVGSKDSFLEYSAEALSLCIICASTSASIRLTGTCSLRSSFDVFFNEGNLANDQESLLVSALRLAIDASPAKGREERLTSSEIYSKRRKGFSSGVNEHDGEYLCPRQISGPQGT